jgi:hypothetical protein
MYTHTPNKQVLLAWLVGDYLLLNDFGLYEVITVCVSYFRSRVAQSVQCLTTDWTTGRSGFDRAGPSIIIDNYQFATTV